MSKENGATELKCFIWVVTRQIQESGIIADLAYSLFLEVFSDLLIHYWLLWILAFTSLFIISLVHASGLLLSFSVAWEIARSWGEVECITVVDPGKEPSSLPLFLDQTEARRAEKKIETPPPHLRVWMTVPSSLIWRSKSAAVLKAQLLNFSQFEKRHLEPGDFPHWHCVRSHCLARSVILMNFRKYQQTKPN